MRIDTTTVNFSGKGQGTELAQFDVRDAREFQILVGVSSTTGSPTSYFASVYAVDDIVLLSADSIRETNTITASGYAIAKYRSTIVNTWVPNVFKRITVKIGFNGGTSPTASGFVKCFTKIV